MTDTALVEVTPEALADAVAGALAQYSVAYTHNTVGPNVATVDRKWLVHETGHGNPFERAVWLGEFDTKAEANAFCGALRRKAAVDAAREHLARIAHQPPTSWQGIETAPRDGTKFLALDGDDFTAHGEYEPYICRREPDLYAPNGGRGGPSGWFSDNWMDRWGDRPIEDCPTLWMPLPAAPAQDKPHAD